MVSQSAPSYSGTFTERIILVIHLGDTIVVSVPQERKNSPASPPASITAHLRRENAGIKRGPKKYHLSDTFVVIRLLALLRSRVTEGIILVIQKRGKLLEGIILVILYVGDTALCKGKRTENGTI